MAQDIIPRWEWRTFGEEFGEAEEKIRAHSLQSDRESSEFYILSTESMQNTKIRADRMDIKVLQQVNEDFLEHWMPVFKEGFPLSKEKIEKVFEAFEVPIPQFARDEYTFGQFLEELVKPIDKLKIVNVKKRRYGYKINDCTVEIAEVTSDDTPTRTVAVEQEDPKKIIETVEQLGLKAYENVNYVTGLKRIAGMKV